MPSYQSPEYRCGNGLITVVIDRPPHDVLGVWGCLPEDYPEVLRLCVQRKVVLDPFVEARPMSQIAQVFDDAHHARLNKRIVLTPDF
ncbi:MAG: hypothetical protein KJZ83_04005 [Burkholderiaceae bacterium]|nr:hypothetical protein [Burkholderiaceae bacterium]